MEAIAEWDHNSWLLESARYVISPLPLWVCWWLVVGSMMFHQAVITSGLTFANLLPRDGGGTKTDESTI